MNKNNQMVLSFDFINYVVFNFKYFELNNTRKYWVVNI